MDFDQMMDSWRSQEKAPLYGVNQDLLQLVLRNEQAGIRRTMRRDQWITYLFGPGLALFAAFWLWVAVLRGAPLLSTLAAGLGTGLFILWVGAFWLSRRRQSLRERDFANSLKDELRRNLSLIDYKISNERWGAALLWMAPVMIGALLVYWLTFQINTSSGVSWWNHAFILLCSCWAIGWTTYASNRAVKQQLEPRRERLRHLLESLNTGE